MLLPDSAQRHSRAKEEAGKDRGARMRLALFVTATAVMLIADQVRTGGYYRREVLYAIERSVPGSGRVLAALY
jgi:hypothetical protein